MPRHEFVFHEYTEQAYADGPLPIGEDQVIIQPSLAARVTQALHLQESEKNTPCLVYGDSRGDHNDRVRGSTEQLYPKQLFFSSIGCFNANTI